MIKIIIFILIILLISLITVSYQLAVTSFKRPKERIYPFKLNKNFEALYQKQKEAQDKLKEYGYEEISIKSFDNTKLVGYFIKNKNQNNKTIICAHGYKSTGMNDLAYQSLFFLTQNYNVLILDDRAHGKSDGNWIGFSILDGKDITCWVKELIANYNQQQIILYGQSMGAASMINAASELIGVKEVKGLISDCSFTSGYELFGKRVKRKTKLPVKIILPITDLMLQIFAHYSLKDKEQINEITKVKIPTLFIQGSDDHLVPSTSCKELFDKSNADKELLIVDKADHIHSYITDKDAYEDAVIRLLNKCK